MNQKNSYPHIVDKVVNKLRLILHLVYKYIFVRIVFYLDIKNMGFRGNAFLDLKIRLIYNVLVYVPMEFRGHE